MKFTLNTKWMAGAGVAFALAANFVGAGHASASTLTASTILSVDSLTSPSGGTVTSGAALSVSGASFEDSEWIGLWINVPDGVVVPADSMGQDNTEVIDGAAAINDLGTADADGNFSYTVDTTNLPAGSYSLVAHGLSSGHEEVLAFTVTGAAAPSLTAGSSAIAAGTPLVITGSAYESDEAIGLWINVPADAAIPAASLGQDNTEVTNGAVGLNLMGSADADGNFSYTLDTTGLPAGTYSLVAHGLSSGHEEVLVFTIQ